MNREYPNELDCPEAIYFAEIERDAGVKLSEVNLFHISNCADSCNGGSHHVEWIVGRAANQSAAAIRLFRSGL